jgi:hypothetical protein
MARGHGSHTASGRYSDAGILPAAFHGAGGNSVRAESVVWELTPRQRVRPRVLPVAMLVAVSGLLGYAAGGGALQLIEAANSRVLRILEGSGESKPLAQLSLPPLAGVEPATLLEEQVTPYAAEDLADLGPLAGKAPPTWEPIEHASLTGSVQAVPPQSPEPDVAAAPQEPEPVPAAPTVSPTRTYLPRDQVRAVQQALAYLGFDPGPIDGSIGKGTRRAISEYQRWQGLRETGELTPEVAAQLAPNAARPPTTRYRPPPETRAIEPAPWISRTYDYPDRER